MKIGIYQRYWGRVGGGQRYIGVVAEWLARRHEVEIVYHDDSLPRSALEEAMEIDLARVALRQVPLPLRSGVLPRNPVARLRAEAALGAELSRPYEVFVDSSDVPPFFCHAPRGVLLTHFPLVAFDAFHGHATAEWQARAGAARWLMEAYHRYEWRHRMSGYRHAIVNSEFTRDWIARRWGLRRAAVVYPPLRSGLQPGLKEPLVLALGAFRHGEHKGHGLMIRSFRRLCDQGLSGWRLVLAGAAGQTPEDQDYVAWLRTRAEGYPIAICTDVPGNELLGLFARASLFWHSMGYGIDSQREPQRMEHFGMVAAEAMAAGCVPLVFDGGGLREIVREGEDGYRWQTVEQLERRTLELAAAPERIAALGQSGRRRTEEVFSRDAFEKSLQAALAPVLGES